MCGKVLGVPYDFRSPSWARLKSNYWNPEDDRIFPPRAFGVGWDVNLYQVHERYPWLFYGMIAATVIVTWGQARKRKQAGSRTR